MDNIGNIVAIVAIVAMVLFLIYKLKPTKKTTAADIDPTIHEDARFVTTMISGDNDEDLFEITGIVCLVPIHVGDSFRMVDEENNVVSKKVIVEKIDTGVVRKKYIPEADVSECVTLFLRMEEDLSDIDLEFVNWYLKK